MMGAAQTVTIYSYWSGRASPSHFADWVKIERDGGAYRRTAGLSQRVDSVNDIDITALLAVINDPAVAELHYDAFGLPKEAVENHYHSIWTNDQPEMQVDVVLVDGSTVRLKSNAQHSFMLPWRIEWLNTPRWILTYNHLVAVALHALLPENFLNRERLTREQIEIDANYLIHPDVPDSPEEPDAEIPGGANIDAKRDDGSTGLMLAVCLGDLESARVWLDGKANPNIADNEGVTPLLKANQPEMARLLLEAGADTSFRDKDGMTALMYAARGNPFSYEEINLALVTTLLEAGADTFAKDNSGRTALDYARENANRYSVAHAVLQAMLGKEQADFLVGECVAMELKNGEPHFRKVIKGNGSSIVKVLEEAMLKTKTHTDR